MSRLHVRRAEMRLERPDVEPLRPVAMDPHPLEPFQRIIQRADPLRGERAEVIVDLLPLQPNERAAYRKRLRRHEVDSFARDMRRGASGMADMFTADLLKMSSPQPTVDVARNEAARRLGESDVDQIVRRASVPTALFYIQILMRTVSPDKSRAQGMIDALVAAWEMWSGRNAFQMVLTDLKLGFIGSNRAPRRWWFDYRWYSARFAPLRHKNARVVTLEDVAGWLTPPPDPQPRPEVIPPGLADPTVPAPSAGQAPQDQTGPVSAAGGPPPSGAAAPVTGPTTSPPGSRVPAAPTTASATPARASAAPAGLAAPRALGEDDLHLCYGIGRRGSAVDRLAAGLVSQAGREGAGVVVLEADGTEHRPDLPEWAGRSSARAVTVLTAGRDGAAAWNPVIPPLDGVSPDRAAAAVRALTVAAGCSDVARAAAVLDAALRTLRGLLPFLPADLTPTLLQVPRLLDDARWRDSVLPVLDAPTRRFWSEVFPEMDDETIGSLLDVIGDLADDPVAVGLVGQPTTTYDPHELLAEGRTVVLSGGPASLGDVLTTLLWFDASAAVRSLAEARARPAPLLVATAAHRYTAEADGLFTEDLQATVDAGARVLLLTDRPDRHSAEMRQALRLVVTEVAIDTVDFGMDVSAAWARLANETELRTTLDALDLDECLLLSARDGWRRRPAAAGRRSRRGASGGAPRRAGGTVRTGLTLEQTRARLDGLEERIAEHLSSPAPEPVGRPDGTGDQPATDDGQSPRSGAGKVIPLRIPPNTRE